MSSEIGISRRKANCGFTIFQIGSTTKAFLAATQAIMVDRGKLRWEDRRSAMANTPFDRVICGPALGPQIPLMIAEGKLPADFEEALTNVACHQDDQYLFLRYRCKLPFKLGNALTIESSDVWQ